MNSRTAHSGSRRTSQRPVRGTTRRTAVSASADAFDAGDGLCRVVVCVGVSGGLGVSTMASMLAWHLARSGMRTAIVDADFSRGGLDVLLGIESEHGLRFGDVTAPLGRLDGNALSHELASWETMKVLSVDPWKDERPDWWEQQAAVKALREVNDVVVIDAGLGEGLADLALPSSAQTVLLAELSVLGLARAKALLGSEPSLGAEGAGRSKVGRSSGGRARGSQEPMIVGISPRVLRMRVVGVGVKDAREYLGREILGALAPSKRLGESILSGTGIPRIPKRHVPVLDALAEAILDGLGHDGHHRIEGLRGRPYADAGCDGAHRDHSQAETSRKAGQAGDDHV
ncbi:MAG: P-loop NTPase [Bifidobacterium crudilactis]|jgi:hypothetical protein|uniref:cobyric acid synthase n=1 Tax=Bifidobacterium crudilactis TaxID=327277 RepID=UPI003A5C2141